MIEARSNSRCAIYTRKSSEEGLDQAFNSLHAQREACEAYVLSRKSLEPAIELFEGREHLGSLSKSKVELTRPSTTFRDRSDPFLQQLQMENG